MAVALVGWLTVSVVWAAPALAGMALAVTPEFPESVTAGDAGVAARTLGGLLLALGRVVLVGQRRCGPTRGKVFSEPA